MAYSVTGTPGPDMCAGHSTDLLFGNEGNDTIHSASGFDTVHGGEGSDNLQGGFDDFQLLVGDEGNDTITGLLGRDTLTGGSGADVFNYGSAGEDGDHAMNQDISTPFSPPSVEVITDVNFNEDRFNVGETIGFAADIGVVNAANLQAAAMSAIQRAFVQGGANQHVAAQFTFNGP
jgi:Ca2+-binding RTX toxin-like protein